MKNISVKINPKFILWIYYFETNLPLKWHDKLLKQYSKIIFLERKCNLLWIISFFLLVYRSMKFLYFFATTCFFSPTATSLARKMHGIPIRPSATFGGRGGYFPLKLLHLYQDQSHCHQFHHVCFKGGLRIYYRSHG